MAVFYNTTQSKVSLNDAPKQEVPLFDDYPRDLIPKDNVITEVVLEPKPTPTGVSAVVEPDLSGGSTATTGNTSATSTTSGGSVVTSGGINPLTPNIGSFLGSISGGGAGEAGGGVATEEVKEEIKKKPFPYWLIAVALVGGYLIFKKEK